MARTGKRDWRGVAFGAAIGASAAALVAILVSPGTPPPSGPAGREAAAAAQPSAASAAPRQARSARAIFSPRVLDDPYVIEQQKRVVETLEDACRRTREYCAEAEQARRRVEEAEAGR